MSSLAAKYGLSSRVNLEQIADNHIGIVKRIKSRIIQKVAIKIVDIANAIRSSNANLKVSLVCNNNICSKSLTLLKKHKVEVLFLD